MLEVFSVNKWTMEGSQGTGAAALAARGFFLKGRLCFQGRDASDQHIVDVVLKMLQGEGRGTNPTSPSRLGHHSPFRSLSKRPFPSVWSPGCSFRLCL